jgi:hypothetical protein
MAIVSYFSKWLSIFELIFWQMTFTILSISF